MIRLNCSKDLNRLQTVRKFVPRKIIFYYEMEALLLIKNATKTLFYCMPE